MQAAAMGGAGRAATMPVRGSGRKAKGAKEAKNAGKGTGKERKAEEAKGRRKQLHKSLGSARMDHCVANLL